MPIKPKRYRPKQATTKKFTPVKKTPFKRRNSLYDKDWDRYRFRFLHHNKTCFTCDNKATVVDHIIPHKGDVELFESTVNHAPFCKGCHDYITGKFDRYNPPKVEEKAKWVAQARENAGITRKIKILAEYRKKK